MEELFWLKNMLSGKTIYKPSKLEVAIVKKINEMINNGQEKNQSVENTNIKTSIA